MKGNDFQGVNAAYVAELYDRYREDPASVDAATRAEFDAGLRPDAVTTAAPGGIVDSADVAEVVGTVNLAECIRRYGHLAATLDPLGSAPVGDPSLAAPFHGVSDGMLARLPASLVAGPVAAASANAFEAITALRRIYCSTTGYDYSHVFVPEERDWLRYAAETCRFRPPVQPIDDVDLLDRLSQVEAFEQFLHRAFPGKTRFSIEGLDMLIPVLDVILDGAAVAGGSDVLLGMAHRGRLNVLAQVMAKPHRAIFHEFKGGSYAPDDVEGSGDVKYHLGASSDR